MKGLKVLLIIMVLALVPAQGSSASPASFNKKLKAVITRDLKKSISEDSLVNWVRIEKASENVNLGNNPSIKSVRLMEYRSPGTLLYSVALSKVKGREVNLTCKVSYEVMVDMFVASRPLLRGTVLTSHDLLPMRQRSSRLPVGAVSSKSDLLGRVLKSNIGQGVVIKERFLASKNTMKRGKKVKVLVKGRGVVLTTHGKLLSSTTIGGVAKVICDASRKEVSGILVSPDTVLITI